MSLTAGRFQETPILETMIHDRITEEQLKGGLDQVRDIWVRLGGEGVLPGRKVRLRDGTRFTLVGLSELDESPEQIRERVARFEETLELYKELFE